MRAFLVTNGFLKSKKHSELFQDLGSLCNKMGIDLISIESDDFASIYLNGIKESEKPDFAIYWDKDIHFAAHLEALGIRTFNSSRAIDLCDDKAKTQVELIKAGLPLPKTAISPLVYKPVDWINSRFVEDSCSNLGFPLVLKEAYGSFGSQVSLIDDKTKLAEVLGGIDTQKFLLQEYIESSKGKDVRVFVVGKKAVCALVRESISGDFRSNLTLGGKAKVFDGSKDYLRLAEQACAALHLDFGGVDLLIAKDGSPIICEVNSNAHYINSQNFTGIKIGQLYLEYIVSEVERAK